MGRFEIKSLAASWKAFVPCYIEMLALKAVYFFLRHDPQSFYKNTTKNSAFAYSPFSSDSNRIII